MTTRDIDYEIDPSLSSTEPKKLSRMIRRYIRAVLDEWEVELSKRSPEEQQTVSGRQAASLYNESSDHLVPLLKQLKKNTVEEDVMYKIGDVLQYVQKREYRTANEAYLRLSIGNSAWPIGVDMVGIHQRTERHKIESNKAVSALNDEVTRKWVHALKRIITWMQSIYPPDNAAMIATS
ncbi:hypothetical protein GQ42DRAFT_140890 [Ramicandelaber brevisporus]|nr:hypothetical protein GQ42DRAFT_140890 [Ramicandelaber brevisporus]